MSVNIVNYCYFLYRVAGMREVEIERFYKLKKYDELYKSILFVNNYKFHFRVFEDENKFILVYLHGIIHYECFKKIW